jgi:hypothetical protein
VKYDIEKQRMYLTLNASNATYERKLELDITALKAEALYKNFSEIDAEVIFDISFDEEEKLGLKMERILLKYDGDKYYARNSHANVSTSTLSAKIDRSKFLQKSFLQKNLQRSTDSLNRYKSVEIAGINLADNWFNQNDELYRDLKNMKQHAVDKKKWLFAVAIENYPDYPVEYALNSGRAVVSLLQKKYGIKSRNTYAFFDKEATSATIKDKMRKMLQNIKAEDEIYFYYSGHGVPTNEGVAYILPVDKDPAFIGDDDAFKIESIYKQLTDSKAKHTYAFIDSCFSGKSSTGLLQKGIAPALLLHKDINFNKERLTILTAGNHTQYSNSYAKKRHRLFSFFLAKYLMEDIHDVKTLYSKIKENVYEISNEMGDSHRQTPQVQGNVRV